MRIRDDKTTNRPETSVQDVPSTSVHHYFLYFRGLGGHGCGPSPLDFRSPHLGIVGRWRNGNSTRARCPAWRALVSLKLRMRLPDFQRCPTALDLIRRHRRMQRLKRRQVAR